MEDVFIDNFRAQKGAIRVSSLISLRSSGCKICNKSVSIVENVEAFVSNLVFS